MGEDLEGIIYHSFLVYNRMGPLNRVIFRSSCQQLEVW